MKKLTTSIFMLFASSSLFAVTIKQKGKVFNVDGKKIEEINIKVGESVTFINDDNTMHNVFSKSEGNAFNLKIQKPKSESVHKFEKEGEVFVRCAIHPKMKLKVKVSK